MNLHVGTGHKKMLIPISVILFYTGKAAIANPGVLDS